jgi:predicted dehydrogenase
MNEIKQNRRGFLKTAAFTAVAFTVVPRKVLGGRFLAPSDELTKAIVGLGSMGRGHIGYPGARLTAVCDVDKKHLALALAQSPAGTKAYHDYRELLTDPSIDIVHIATPPHWHGKMAVDAAKAGKDIWCEKPMTRTIGEGLKVKEAVERHGRIFRLNTWFRFSDTFYGMGTTVKPLRKLVDSRLLGWPLTVTVNAATGFDWKFYWVGKTGLTVETVPDDLDYDMWLGPAPFKPYNSHRVHGTFRGYWDYDGGGLGDMGQHYLDPVQYFLGKDDETPVEIIVDAQQQDSDACGTWKRIELVYKDGCRIVLDGENRDKDAAYIEGPNGKLYPGFRSTIANLMETLAKYPDPVEQNSDFAKSVRTRKPFALNERNGFRSATLVNLAIIAVRLGRSLKFDPEKFRFIDDPGADLLINQPARAPWAI